MKRELRSHFIKTNTKQLHGGKVTLLVWTVLHNLDVLIHFLHLQQKIRGLLIEVDRLLKDKMNNVMQIKWQRIHNYYT